MGSLQLWLTVGGVLSKHEQILGEKIQNFILKLLVTTDFQITSFVQAIACLAAVAVAKPEAEADPALLYGAYGYAGLGHVGYPYAGYGYGYAGYPFAAGRYVANSAGVVHVAKREAEAEPEADAAYFYGGYGYAGLGHVGYPYAYGYAGYPYAAAGYASYSPSASTSIAGLAPAAVPAVAGGYGGAGRYVANSAGVVHVAKREAEADPALLYGAYGYAGLGHIGYPYAYGYAGYPYAAAGYASY